MITDKDRVIKVSFYYQPTDDIFDADDMRNALYNFLDSFKMYDLQVKDTTIELEQKEHFADVSKKIKQKEVK